MYQKKSMKNLLENKCGATALEYALIAALTILVVIAAINLFASNMGSMFNEIENAISDNI